MENSKFDVFVEQVLEFEAESILMDLVSSPVLVELMFDFSEVTKRKCIQFIVKILRGCFDAKNLQIAISSEGGELCGYAMVFVMPGEYARYLHKIFVYDEFRGRGIGSDLLALVVEGNHTMALICSTGVEKFYENRNFYYVKNFEVPASGNFSLSKHLYAGLVFMVNGEGYGRSPVFLLNDDDIRSIMKIVLEV